MYESPIAKIVNEMQTQMVQEEENMVMKAVREVGITVDKEELINALQYDRKQYTKGYSDGYSDGKSDTLDKIRAEIEELPTKTRINWDGCCPDVDYPEIEYVDVTKNMLLSIIDKHRAESEE